MVPCCGGESYDGRMASEVTHLRIAVCQINPTVGDLDGNVGLAVEAVATGRGGRGRRGRDAGDDDHGLSAPEDLVLKPGFVADCRAALEKFAAQTARCAAVIGFADGDPTGERVVPDLAGTDFANDVWNAIAVCAEGRIFGTYHKRHLPNYDVFDELRHFRPGRRGLRPVRDRRRAGRA